MEVDYVSRGRDATVDWGNIDFKFKNTSSEPVYICCVLDSGKNVRVGIFGRLLEDGVSIALDTTTVSRTNYETQYVLNASLAPGARQLKQSGKYAYVTDTYKVLLDRDGNELARSYMFRSRYLGRPQIYELGP